MVSCSAACKIPLATIRAAKRAGAPGFDQAGRVHLGLLLPWFFASGDALSGTDWHQRLKRAQALRVEHETAKRRGQLVDAAILGAQLTKGGGAMKSALMNAVALSAPQMAAAGDDVAANREALRAVLWQAFEQVRDAMAPYLEAVDAHTRAEVERISNPTDNEENQDQENPSHDDGREGAPAARRQRPRRGPTQEGAGEPKDSPANVARSLRASTGGRNRSDS